MAIVADTFNRIRTIFKIETKWTHFFGDLFWVFVFFFICYSGFIQLLDAVSLYLRKEVIQRRSTTRRRNHNTTQHTSIHVACVVVIKYSAWNNSLFNGDMNTIFSLHLVVFVVVAVFCWNCSCSCNWWKLTRKDLQKRYDQKWVKSIEIVTKFVTLISIVLFHNWF